MSQRMITSFFSVTTAKKSDETQPTSTHPLNSKENVNTNPRTENAKTSPVNSSKAKVSKKSPKTPAKTAKRTIKESTTSQSKTKTKVSKTPSKQVSENGKRKSKEQAPAKKRARIVAPIDSSDEEGHLPLPASPENNLESKEERELTETVGSKDTKEPKETVKSKGKDEPKEAVKSKDTDNPKEAVTSEDENELKETENIEEAQISKETSIKLTSKNTENSYNPSASNYHPIKDACWKQGQKVPYLAFAQTLGLIEETSARLKIIEILSNYLRSVIVLSPNDLLASVYLCLNQLAPAYKALELGVADTNLMKAIAQCTGRSLAQIKADVQEVGDLGIVAEGSRSNQRTMFQPPPLTVSNVFAKLKDIAEMTGHASLAKKLDMIQSLFVACRQTEARYLVRSLAGKLRIGLAEQSVLQALALACVKTPPEQKSYPPEILNASETMSPHSFKQKYEEIALIIKTTYCECPNYDLMIPIILEQGVESLPEKCKITPGVPMKPMLAHPTKGVQEVLTRFEGLKFTCEWKYDGERAQIHIAEDGEISIYSRNQENNTSKYPDIITRLKKIRPDTVKSCILDCEVVAWCTEKKQILPFQILSTRKRKDANETDIKVRVCVYMFDLLYLNNEPLVKEAFLRRRELLKQHFIEIEGEWQFAKSMDTTTMEQVEEFLDESVKGNCEGLMVKTLEEEATYEIAKRSRNWLKLKKDYLDNLGDTLDVVVIGGYLGKGKRTGTYGGFLLACYDEENEEYQSICKIGTGFSEEDLQKYTETFKELVVEEAKSYYRFDSSHKPDHWFEPSQVWEIKCADLSLSPVHKAAMGIVDPEKGISLRFPRFVRVREDKTCDQSTTAQQIADLYNNQEQIKNQTSSSKTKDEDFY